MQPNLDAETRGLRGGYVHVLTELGFHRVYKVATHCLETVM